MRPFFDKAMILLMAAAVTVAGSFCLCPRENCCKTDAKADGPTSQAARMQQKNCCAAEPTPETCCSSHDRNGSPPAKAIRGMAKAAIKSPAGACPCSMHQGKGPIGVLFPNDLNGRLSTLSQSPVEAGQDTAISTAFFSSPIPSFREHPPGISQRIKGCIWRC